MAGLSQMSLPEGSRGRLLAGLVTLVALVFVWIGAVQPLIDLYAEGADDIAQLRAVAGRTEDMASTLPALRREARAVAKIAPPPASTLAGASDAIAAASLQSMLEGMTTQAGAHLTSAEALPAEQVGNYRRVALRVSVDATWTTLIHLMQAIERATPHMFVDELQLHAQPTSEKVRELPLDISFTLLAFRSATPLPAGAGAGADASGAGGGGGGDTGGTDSGSGSDSQGGETQ